MKAAPIPGEIQALLDERHLLLAEARRFDQQAKAKREEAASLHARINLELANHSNALLKEYMQAETARTAAKSKIERSPSTERNKSSDLTKATNRKATRAEELAAAVKAGDWDLVARLS